MNIYSIKEGLSALQEIGCTMNAAERMKLQMGLLRLIPLANANELLFWGKIYTSSQPYYIAMAVHIDGHYAFPQKKFYYSRDKMIFEELPSLDDYHKGKVDTFNHLPFSGDPATVLINVEGEQNKEAKEPEQKQEDEDSEQEKVVIVPKNFTELNRLSHVVRSIQIESQVVPVGAFRMCEKHELRYNNSFHGLSLKSFALSQFQHFRYPKNEKVLAQIQKPQCIFKYDFLDPLENESYWSIQSNTTQNLITVRQLEWQGYVGYHFLGTKEFGGVYFGSGCKNTQIPFCV